MAIDLIIVFFLFDIRFFLFLFFIIFFTMPRSLTGNQQYTADYYNERKAENFPDQVLHKINAKIVK